MTSPTWTMISPEEPRRPTCLLAKDGILWINEDATVHELRVALSTALRLAHYYRRAGAKG